MKSKIRKNCIFFSKIVITTCSIFLTAIIFFIYHKFQEWLKLWKKKFVYSRLRSKKKIKNPLKILSTCPSNFEPKKWLPQTKSMKPFIIDRFVKMPDDKDFNSRYFIAMLEIFDFNCTKQLEDARNLMSFASMNSSTTRRHARSHHNWR